MACVLAMFQTRPERPMLPSWARDSGFTLVEMVISLALIGILAGMMAAFLPLPMHSHFVTRQRLILSDGAEAAVHRLDQELRQALPNSVRVTQVGPAFFLEFLPVQASGRVRGGAGGLLLCPGGNQLQVGSVDNCFTTLGSTLTGNQIVPNQHYVVVNNLGPGFPIANAYLNGNANGPNKSRVTAVTLAAGGGAPEDRIQIQPWNFPALSPSRRFHVVSGAVTYECNPASGLLRRYANYGIVATQPTPPAGVPVLMVSAVSRCRLTYNANAGGLMDGLVTISLDLSQPVPGDVGREIVRIFAQVPVSTTP